VNVLISFKIEPQIQGLLVSICSLFDVPNRRMVSLRIFRGIPSHLADHYTSRTNSVFARRFLQTTQAKQLDVKRMHILPQE